MWTRIARLLRAGLAGLFATGADILTLSLLVAAGHWPPRSASLPALFVGAIVNFIGNRDYVFRARAGSVTKQALGYATVELVALALNGLAYDTVLRLVPEASRFFWLVRLCTTNLVFLVWSYPLWSKVFRVRSGSPTPNGGGAQRRAPMM
jgi:putative flippase GtrA